MIFHLEIMKTPVNCIELPRTADSIPFDAAYRLVESINLADCGFAEREFILKGFSHVYEWSEGQERPSVQTKSAPYCTKALARLPEELRRDPATSCGKTNPRYLRSKKPTPYPLNRPYSNEHQCLQYQASIGALFFT